MGASASFLYSNAKHQEMGRGFVRAAVARIECHYFVQSRFLAQRKPIVDDVPRIRHIPATNRSGTYDVVCPATSAWDLHRAWPRRIAHRAGRRTLGIRGGNTHELVLATDRYRKSLKEAEEFDAHHSFGRARRGRSRVAVVRVARGATKLLRFPRTCGTIGSSSAMRGDCGPSARQGGTAAPSHLEIRASSCSVNSLPTAASIAFTGQYGGDEQVRDSVRRRSPKQLTFYPSPGPLAERWGYDNQVYGWTPDGTAVLFRSARDGYMLTDSKLYRCR